MKFLKKNGANINQASGSENILMVRFGKNVRNKE
jgi:hypothetical protein